MRSGHSHLLLLSKQRMEEQERQHGAVVFKHQSSNEIVGRLYTSVRAAEKRLATIEQELIELINGKAALQALINACEEHDERRALICDLNRIDDAWMPDVLDRLHSALNALQNHKHNRYWYIRASSVPDMFTVDYIAYDHADAEHRWKADSKRYACVDGNWQLVKKEVLTLPGQTIIDDTNANEHIGNLISYLTRHRFHSSCMVEPRPEERLFKKPTQASQPDENKVAQYKS